MSIYPNETVKSIMERRSVRKFKPAQITDAELDCIIGCGLRAPSAMNTQNWHFTVVQNAGTIARIIGAIRENMPPEALARNRERRGDDDFDPFYGAPTLVLVSGDAKDAYTDANCGYAVENVCVAAQSLGVASIIIGMMRMYFMGPDAETRARELGVPDGYRPLYAVCLGYADMTPAAPELMEGRVSYIK